MTRNSRRLTVFVSLLSLLAVGLWSCSSDETYAKQKERERDAINNFLTRDVQIVNSDGDTVVSVGRINVIDEAQFLRQDSVTRLENNEYVLFGSTGVYMQIVRKGVGGKLESGDNKCVIARYLEFNIMADSVQSTNRVPYFATTPDYIDISNTYGTFTATFNITRGTEGGGAMYRFYGSTEVPAGWLVPFTYIHIGRLQKDGDEISKVRLIVPHTKGTAKARQSVYPTFYEITFQEADK